MELRSWSLLYDMAKGKVTSYGEADKEKHANR